VRIRLRFDRLSRPIPVVGDLLHFTQGAHVGYWKVVERKHEISGWDPINEQLWIAAVELELERYP
jgi:hypothetical protein